MSSKKICVHITLVKADQDKFLFQLDTILGTDQESTIQQTIFHILLKSATGHRHLQLDEEFCNGKTGRE